MHGHLLVLTELVKVGDFTTQAEVHLPAYPSAKRWSCF